MDDPPAGSSLKGDGSGKGKGTGKNLGPPFPSGGKGYKGSVQTKPVGKMECLPRSSGTSGDGGGIDLSNIKLKPTETRVRKRDGTVLCERRAADGNGFEASVVGKEETPQYVLDQEAGRSQLTPKVFDPSSNRWVPKQIASTDEENVDLLARCTVRVVTYNVWFSEYRQRQRATALFKLLHHENADIICLQEVTLAFLLWLREEKWVREGYILSDAVGTTLRGKKLAYGVIMLIRQSVAVRSLYLFALPTQMNRSALVAVFPLGGGQELRVATVHLESLNNDKTRASQLDRICQIIGSNDDAQSEVGVSCANDSNICLLAGDLNFDDGSDLEEAVIEKAGFADCWVVVSASKGSDHKFSADKGCTMPVCDYLGCPTRIDRILLRSSLDTAPLSLLPSDIYRIGMDPLDADVVAPRKAAKAVARSSSDSEDTDPDMPALIPVDASASSGGMKTARDTPSDHYGLVCNFVVRAH
eukprot:TRINITY_DN33048_c0_g1_i2.p1 TRINITY_DN33048_c0_g1~~TRINITY_DN33048_c0_g1_i2.p1  ORF type:complete len:472 (-),score=66.23 TRINITY_DN33048_c0_g1_i2:50-1465(-)